MANGKDFAQEAADRLNDAAELHGFNRVWETNDYGKHPESTAYADLLAELSDEKKLWSDAYVELKKKAEVDERELSAVKADMGEIARLCDGSIDVTDSLRRMGQQTRHDAARAIAAKYAPKPDPLVEALRALPPVFAGCVDAGVRLRDELAKRGLELRSIQGGE